MSLKTCLRAGVVSVAAGLPCGVAAAEGTAGGGLALAGPAGAPLALDSASAIVDQAVLMVMEERGADDTPAADVKPEPAGFFSGWTGSIDVGGNGSSGNSENFAVRAALNAKRETSEMVTAFLAQYVYGTSDGDKNTDRGELSLRNDWTKLAPWRFYMLGRAEYDQFQDWDWRLSYYAGVGYELIKNDTTLFLPRIGVGFSKELGGSDNRIKPELDIGFDLEHKLNDRSKVFVVYDYYPSLLNFPKDFRMVTKAGYEVVVAPESKMSLKLGLEHRYQAIPGEGKKKNDLLYFALLSWGF